MNTWNLVSLYHEWIILQYSNVFQSQISMDLFDCTQLNSDSLLSVFKAR